MATIATLAATGYRALAGMIAVPCYPPDGARKERTLPRLAGIVADAQPALLLTTRAVAETLPSLADAAPWLSALTVLVTDDLAPLAAWSAPLVLPDAPAVIQYTSGSTAALPCGRRVHCRAPPRCRSSRAILTAKGLWNLK